MIEWLENLIINYSYLGIFLVSLITSATLFIPFPSQILLMILSLKLNPFLLSLSAALGSSFGELTSYILSYGSLKVIEKKKESIEKYINKIKMLGRKSTFALIFLFALTPLPDDIIGIYCGLTNYDVKKYFIATFLGKFLFFIALTYLSKYSFSLVLQFI